MVVKLVSDLCLREAGRGFIISLKASNHYSKMYLDALEQTLALASLNAEEQGWPPVAGITTAHVEEYLTYLQTRPRWFGDRETGSTRTVAPSYINAQYRRLNRFFNWMVERGYVDGNPLRLIACPKVEERMVPTVSDQQMLDLLTLLDPGLARTPAHRFRLLRNRAVLFLLWDTPGRRDEMATLNLEGVDLEAGTIMVMGKGGKERYMPIGDTARSVLWEYLQVRAAKSPSYDAVWISEQGRTMEPGWLYQMLKRLGKRAGIPNLHTHRFRHSYAVNALRGGMPERVLQIVGGWRKIPDTYFRTLDGEDARQFHRAVSPGDRLAQGARTGISKKRRAQTKPRGKL
jgi:site-specific recombinase XerD